MDSSDSAGWHFLHMIRFIFYSVRTLIHQQSPKLVLTDSNMGLMLTASANLITKVPLMFQFLPSIVARAGGALVSSS